MGDKEISFTRLKAKLRKKPKDQPPAESEKEEVASK